MTNSFPRLFNIQSMAFQLPEFDILTLAQMIIILTAGINLSIGFTAALSSIVGASLMVAMNSANYSPVLSLSLGIAAMVAMGVLCGMFNGGIVAFIGVSPILATLGSMTLFDGLLPGEGKW